MVGEPVFSWTLHGRELDCCFVESVDHHLVQQRVPRKDDIGTIQRRIAWTGARMMCAVVTMGAIGPSGPSAFCEAPAGLSLSSQRVRLKLSAGTQGSTLQTE